MKDYLGIIINLLLFLYAVIVINFFINKNYNKSKKIFKQYIEDEQAANFDRANEIPIDMYLTISDIDLPYKDLNTLQTLVSEEAATLIHNHQQSVKLLQGTKMIKPTELLKNIDIKKAYGVNNFELFTSCEQNHNMYIKALYQWASALYNADLKYDAISVLQHSIDMRSDNSATYILLIDIYFDLGRYVDINNMNRFLQSTTNFATNDIGKTKVQNKIDTII